MPTSMFDLKLAPILFESEWLGVNLRMDTKKTCVEKRLTMCSKVINHSRHSNQHKWRGRGPI